MKKLLSVLLVFVLCFGAISASAATVWDTNGQAYWVNDWEVDNYRYAGYLSSDDIYYGIIQPNYNSYKSSRNYYDLLKLVTDCLPYTYGSAHEKSMYVIRTEAMYLWYLSCGYPVGVSDVSVSDNKVVFKAANLTYKDITYMEFKYYSGGATQVATGYISDFTPGCADELEITSSSGYIYSASNLRVSYIRFADGTSWGTRSY